MGTLNDIPSINLPLICPTCHNGSSLYWCKDPYVRYGEQSVLYNTHVSCGNGCGIFRVSHPRLEEEGQCLRYIDSIT